MVRREAPHIIHIRRGTAFRCLPRGAAPGAGYGAVQAGIDPLHFALIMLVNLNIGMITPPFGMTLLTSARIAGCSYDRTILAVWPFLAAEVATLLLITYTPTLTLVIPRALGFQ